MKYSFYLTSDAAACLLTGLEEFGDINTAAVVYYDITGDDQFDGFAVGPESRYSALVRHQPDPEELREALLEANEIERALRVFLLADPDKRTRLDERGRGPTLSRQEIAKYFRALGTVGDHYSKIAEGTIAPRSILRKDEAAERHSLKLTTKTRNSYLTVIDALTKTVINGSTGSSGKDAEAAIKAIELFLGEPPVTPKTLAKYLAEARQE
jgi:hypothetical protein